MRNNAIHPVRSPRVRGSRIWRWLLASVVTVSLAVLTLGSGTPHVQATAPLNVTAAATTTTVPASASAEQPAAAANSTTSTVPFTVAPEFEPENGELGNCVGSFAERPGCGATGRGGWRQTLVFLLLVGGLAFIAARIIIGVRRNSSRT